MTATAPTKLVLDSKFYNESEQQRIAAADRFAALAHRGQKRKSGVAYINHPRAVASYLAELGLDADTVIAGLLHDTVEDTAVTLDQISQQFGPEVAKLVDGVTKLGEVDYAPSGDSTEQRQAISRENIRKLLLALSKDLRVLMIKLADRRHNLQTLQHLKVADRHRIAQESLDIYVPLADRLGMGVLKAEMEDLAFKYANPQAYNLVKRLLRGEARETKTYIDKLTAEVKQLLRREGITAVSVHGRQKNLMSIYRKLTKTDGDITKIYDLMALRIIVPSESDCYQVLGVIHQHYKPLIYRIKDYIAVPKPNGYRSLHTTVFALDGHITEIQIRTPQMHTEAEQGLAAHALYNLHKDSRGYAVGRPAGKASRNLRWIQELASVSASADTGSEFMQNLKIDLFQDRIFVFSPHGDLYDLPEGATPIDFAFAVHTNIGLRTQGARVNNRMIPLDSRLQNRDVVEIITKKTPGPNRQWLNFVTTTTARDRIRTWFRAASRETNVAHGRELLEAQLPTWGHNKLDDIGVEVIKAAAIAANYKDVEAFLAAVGEGALSVQSALRRLFPPPKTSSAVVGQAGTKPTKPPASQKVLVVGAPELPTQLAACCNPQPVDELIGYITRGSGVTVHRGGCANLPKEPDRYVECFWEDSQPGAGNLPADIKLITTDRVGLLRDIISVISARGINIVEITTKSNAAGDGLVHMNIGLVVPSLFSLSALVADLQLRDEVKSVKTIRQDLAT